MSAAQEQGLHAGVVVHTGQERQLAVSHWLLSVARDKRTARIQWQEHGVALLACGRTFAAVRLPAGLVHAAAGSHVPEAVDAYLRRVLDGPVFTDRYAQLYYALVPASTRLRWPVDDLPGTDCLGLDHYLGVPAVDITDPERGRSYWCVPMDSPGELCDPADVARLVREGYRCQDEEGAGQ